MRSRGGLRSNPKKITALAESFSSAPSRVADQELAKALPKVSAIFITNPQLVRQYRVIFKQKHQGSAPMSSPSTKAPNPGLTSTAAGTKPSQRVSNTATADYVYRIAAMTAGIALLMTVV